MKCIQSIAQPNDVFKTSNKQARVMVLSGEYLYCSKSKWKSSGQDFLNAFDIKLSALGKINQKREEKKCQK